jgi:hypothetical protein
MSASGSVVLALPHGGAPAAGAASVGHGRRRGVVQRISPHSFEHVGASGSLGSFRTPSRGHRNRSLQSVPSPSRRLAADPKRRGLFAPIVLGQDSFGHSGHQVGVRRTAGAFHVSRFGFRHRWRHHAPLGGSFERLRSLARFRRQSLIRRAVQHANGAVAPDGPVLSCRRGARLICNVRATKQQERRCRTSTHTCLPLGIS